MKTLLSSIVLLLIALVSPAFAELAGTKPNIILVMTDDQGYAPLGRHGHPWLKTPHLDALHDQSTRFTRFLVAPTCSPTRAAIMTGRHPEKNGITHTILERERMTLRATILPQVLKTAGYTSGIFGKWHLGDELAYQPGARGFDVFMKCFEKGVLIRTTADTIALSPPLIISKEQIDELVGTVADVLRAAART